MQRFSHLVTPNKYQETIQISQYDVRRMGSLPRCCYNTNIYLFIYLFIISFPLPVLFPFSFHPQVIEELWRSSHLEWIRGGGLWVEWKQTRDFANSCATNLLVIRLALHFTPPSWHHGYLKPSWSTLLKVCVGRYSVVFLIGHLRLIGVSIDEDQRTNIIKTCVEKRLDYIFKPH